MERVSDDYYIFHCTKNAFVKVDAVPVTIGRFDDLDLFAYNTAQLEIYLGSDVQHRWIVTEGKSGRSVSGYAKDTIEEAISEADHNLTTRTKIAIPDRIAKAIAKTGLSPRWRNDE